MDIYICEDRGEQRRAIAAFVADYCKSRHLDASVVLSTHSPAEILEHFTKHGKNPALFFLDIGLQAEINGIELARQIREQATPSQKVFIVFLTIHSEMAFMTFQYQVEALDFISKDSPEKVKQKIAACIDTAFKRQSGGRAKTVQISIDKKIILLDIDEIIYIETTHVRHKLRLHTKSRVIEFNAELKTMEAQLDEGFLRCHRSYIINRDKITAIDKKTSTVTMQGGSTCPLSRSGKKLL